MAGQAYAWSKTCSIQGCAGIGWGAERRTEGHQIHTHQHQCRTSETLSLVSMGLSGKSPCLLENEGRALGSTFWFIVFFLVIYVSFIFLIAWE